MTTIQQLVSGMTIAFEGDVYRVESAVKVTVPKGTPFTKVKLRNLTTNATVERNFKVGQPFKEASLTERKLEYLYPENKGHLFLDLDTLEQIPVPAFVVGDKVQFLKEGVEVKGSSVEDTVLSIELPQFLELMVVKTDTAEEGQGGLSHGTKTATLETGAKVKVPLFIETGDIIKTDTQTGEYIQRV